MCNCPVSTSHTQDTQTLSRDVYLVLRIKSFETPLDPSMVVQRSIQNGFRYYSFLDGNGEDIVVCLHEPSPREPQAQEDLETFDSILAQYSEIQGLQAQVVSADEKPEDLRGHVVRCR
jgi:spartin